MEVDNWVEFIQLPEDPKVTKRLKTVYLLTDV